MNTWLIIGAVLTVAIGVAHSVLGEKHILIRLFRRDNLPYLLGSDVFTKQTLRFAWHLTTIAWWGFAALLVLYATRGSDAGVSTAASIIEIVFLASALVTLIATRGRHLAWVVFLGIAAAAWFGGR